MKNKKIEFYHLGLHDVRTNFAERVGKSWWPDSSQYQRGCLDGLKKLKERNHPDLPKVFVNCPVGVQKRFIKAYGHPVEKYEAKINIRTGEQRLVKRNIFQRFIGWLFRSN